MITEMFIEGQQVDVSEYFSTLITYAIDDIKDFSARNTSFSKTIVLPGTARNNKIFGNIFEMEAANPYNDAIPNVLINFNAAKSAGCYIFQDNIQVFKGVVRLLEVIVDKGRKEYEVAVFGELGGLAASLGNKKLEDLDFSAYDQTLSVANIIASWDNASGAGLFYPHIDYGTYSTDKHNWQYRTFRPALFAREYVNKIFAASGYRYQCSLFDTTRFKQLIIPHNQKRLTRLGNSLFTAERHTFYSMMGEDPGHSAQINYVFDSFSSSVFSTTDNAIYKYTDTAAISSAVIEINIKGDMLSPGSDFEFAIFKNADISPLTVMYLGASDDAPYDVTLTVITSLATNDTFRLQVANPGSVDYGFQITGTSASFKVSTSAVVQIPIALGDTVKINESIPKNILQKDFFSSIVKLFNLYVYESRDDEKLLNITPYVDFYDIDPGNAVDWSSKLNRDKAIRIKPLSELNSRYYNFSFKSDSDYYNDLYTKRYNQNYGDYKYDSEFEFAQEEDKAEVIFSGTPLVGYTGEDKVYSTILKQTGSTTIVEENVDSNIRILQTKKITSVSSWDMLNGATVLGSYTYYGYAGHLDDPNAPANDIQFGVPKELFFNLVTGALHVNQFNVYWSPYMAEITDKDSRLLTATFRLNARDIYNLDFSKMVYLDGGLYRLVKIEDYNASREDECTVTLLKVIQTLY